jgi:hypothetical protein
MKKLLFILAITISNLSFGQITLEHAYTTDGFNNIVKTYAFHTESGLYYFTMNQTENKVLIYNASHTLYKTVILNLGANYKISTVYLATDKLFNTNANIEFIVVSYNSNLAVGKMTLFDEDGANLFEFGDRFEANCFKNSDTNFKLIVATEKDYPNYYEVYNLPGTLSVAQQEMLINNQFYGFPNPASNRITIINSLESGKMGMLEVFDVSGKKVLERNVLGNNQEINLDITNLENGVYIYKLNGKTNRFIKK